MEEKIKEIVSVFIKVPPEQIGAGTPIGRTALQSSILLHRMYARLGEEGVVVSDYAEIKVFGDLMRRQGGTGSGSVGQVVSKYSDSASSAPTVQHGDNMTPGIGIDIEEIAALPRVDDLRMEPFYVQNFTPGEIAYCTLQADPYASLAGLWAAKEAIIKADGQYRNRPFQTIEIGHTADGKPVFPGLGLSISHSGGMAVAVAAAVRGGFGDGFGDAVKANVATAAPARNQSSAAWITWIALLLAAAALLLALKHS